MGSEEHIFWRDEILQILVWMRGEGLGEQPSAAGLSMFLNLPSERVQTELERMARDGYVQAAGAGYSLTEMGRAEGARRFREEFAPLQGHGHGECDDPSCECHETGPANCAAL